METIRLSLEAGDSRVEWSAHLDLARVLTGMGRTDEALLHPGAALELAERFRDRFQSILTYRTKATLYRYLGDWRRSREHGDRGLAVRPRMLLR